MGIPKSPSSLLFCLSCTHHHIKRIRNAPFHFLPSASFTSFGIATPSKTFVKKSVRGNRKGFHFHNVDDALNLFQQMVHKHPRPSLVEFNKLLVAIAKMKQYAVVVSLCSQMELLRIIHDIYTLSILINCFCRLHRVDFGFSVFGKMFRKGYQPDVVTYSTILNGLCKIGNTCGAVRLLRMMEERGFQPDVVAYNTVINNLCKDRLLTETLILFAEMKGKGIPPDAVSYNSLIHGMCNLGQLNEATRLLDQMLAANITPDVVSIYSDFR